MTPALVKLSELIIEYGDPSEVVDAFEAANLIGTFNKRDVLRCLLSRDPYESLSDMIGPRRRLLAIAEKMDIEEVNSSMSRDTLLGIILSVTLGNIYPSELQVSGFYVAEKAIKKARSAPDDQKYADTHRIVKRVEFLIKHLYRLIIQDNLLMYLNEDLQKEITKQKGFVPLKSLVSTINKAEQYSEQCNREEQRLTPLTEACQKLLGRPTPFPGFDLALMNRFVELRNKNFGHQSTYTSTHHDELRVSSQMLDLLHQICDFMKPIAPQVIIQIYYEQDHLGRNKIFYLEEDKDFDEEGRLLSVLYLRNKNRWKLRECKYYCMVPEPRESYKPGVPAYLLPGSETTIPYIDPRVFSASDLRQWESIVAEQDASEGKDDEL